MQLVAYRRDSRSKPRAVRVEGSQVRPSRIKEDQASRGILEHAADAALPPLRGKPTAKRLQATPSRKGKPLLHARPPRWPVIGVPGEVSAIDQHLPKNGVVVTYFFLPSSKCSEKSLLLKRHFRILEGIQLRGWAGMYAGGGRGGDTLVTRSYPKKVTVQRTCAGNWPPPDTP